MSEMLKVSEVFKSNFNYYQREEDFLERFTLEIHSSSWLKFEYLQNVQSKLNSVERRFEFGIKQRLEWWIKCSYLAQNNGQNWVKKSQTLEKFSQPRDLSIWSNENVFQC